jgi:hypothetical protein
MGHALNKGNELNVIDTTKNIVLCNQLLCNWHEISCHLQLSWSCLQL